VSGVPRRRDESQRTTAEQEVADLAAAHASLPGWWVWAPWHCGSRTWHAVPADVAGSGRDAWYRAERYPHRVTAGTRDELVRVCRERQP
jgi:hypothetical protein